MRCAEAAALFRRAAEARYGWVRRDRGEGLFIAREPRPGAPDEGLLCETARGALRVLSPSGAGARALSALLPDCPDRPMEPFRGGSCPPEDLVLLARGLKLCEERAPGEAWLYRVDVQRRAAVLLREKRAAEGGALYVCAQLVHALEALS